MKLKVIGYIIGILLLGILIERLYTNFFTSPTCENEISKIIFSDKSFRKKYGLPIFNEVDYLCKKSILDNGKTIKFIAKSYNKSKLREVYYYCHTNSEKDVFQINNGAETFTLEVQFYFKKPEKVRFMIFSETGTYDSKILTCEEAKKLLLGINIFGKSNEHFYDCL